MAEDEFTELLDADFPRVDLVGKAANGVNRPIITKSAFSPADVAAFIKKTSASAATAEDSDGDTMNDTEVTKADDNDAPDASEYDLDAGSDPLVGEDDNVPGSESWETVDAASAMKWLNVLARAQHAIEILADREAAEAQAQAGDWDDVDALCATLCAITDAIGALAPFAVGEATEAAFAGSEGVVKAALKLEADPFPLTTIEGMSSAIKLGKVPSATVAKAAKSLLGALSTLPEASKEEVTKMQAEVKKAGDVGPQDEISSQASQDGQYSQSAPSGSSSDIDGPNQPGYEISPADNTVAVPADVKTLAGLAGSQEDLSGQDGTLGAPAVDQGVVTKAAPQQAVYDSKGNLLGTVDPGKITQLIGEGTKDAAQQAAPAQEDESADSDSSDDTTSGDDAAPAATPPADMAPAPAATVGTPAEGVAKAEVAEIIKAAVAETESRFDSVVKSLQDEINHLKSPAQSRVLMNGALPPTNMLRGMDKGDQSVDVAKAEELRSRFDSARSAGERDDIADQMNQNAIATWNAMRSGR